MTPAPPMLPRARLLAGLAVAGAVPLTAGVIMWVLGAVMRLAYHGRWGATASVGAALVLVGVVCGLMLFVFAAGGQRRPPSWATAPGGTAVPGGPTTQDGAAVPGWSTTSTEATVPGAAAVPGGADLVPLASPEQQAILADPRPATTTAAPGPAPASPGPARHAPATPGPAPATPGPVPATPGPVPEPPADPAAPRPSEEGQQPRQGPWSDSGMPSGWTNPSAP